MKYRPLNDSEMQAVSTLRLKTRIPFILADLLRYSQVAYQTFKESGFTVCIIKLPSGVILSGASRKSQKDKFNRVKGDMEAFVRTVEESKELIP